MDKVWTTIFFLGYSPHGQPLKAIVIDLREMSMITGPSKDLIIIENLIIPRQNMDKAFFGLLT